MSRVALTTGRHGNFNFANSLTFDTASNRYGSATPAADIQVSSRSLEWWTSFDIVPAGTTPIFSMAVANYYIGFNINTLFTSYVDAGAVQRTVQSSTLATSMRPRRWRHYAVTINTSGMNVDVSFYADGSLLNTSSRTDGHSSSYGGALILGAFSGGALNVDGKLANVGFYNRALTAAEVMMRARCLPVTSGNLHRWLMTEGSGATLADSIGSINFTLVNSPIWSSVNVPFKARVAVS